MESHEAGGSEGADDGAGDELGPGFPDAPAGEDTGEPGVLGGHILDVGFWILDFGFIEFRGLRPPNLLIVNSHLSIVNGQGGIGGIYFGFY